MKFEIPKPIKIERDELHADLVTAIKSDAQPGEAAEAVAGALYNHFLKEEGYALLPLGLRVSLSQGKYEAEMAEVMKMTDTGVTSTYQRGAQCPACSPP